MAAPSEKPPAPKEKNGNALLAGATTRRLEDESALTVQTALLGVLTALALAFALKAAAGVLLPFVLAVFLSVILAPVMSALSARGVPERLTLPLAMGGLVSLLIPLEFVVAATVEQISERVPYYGDRFTELLQRSVSGLGSRGQSMVSGGWTSELSSTLGGFSVDLFGSVITFLGNLFLVITCTVFILLGRASIGRNVDRAFEPRRARELRDILRQAIGQVQRYLVAKVLLSLATGLCMYFVLLFFHVDFAPFWGLLGFLLNFIPTLGSVIAAVLPIVVALLQFEGREGDAIWVAVGLIAVQQIIGNFIEPKVQGDRLNLSPIVILFALVFFGWLWGFVGMVLSVPLIAVLKITFEHSRTLRPVAIMMER